jgi:hypothetical protein
VKPQVHWSSRSELHVSFANEGGAGHDWRVEGLTGFTAANPSIVQAGSAAPAGPHVVLRPLTPPPGPFDLAGLLLITPFVEVAGGREALVAFEERIGRRYYEYILGARFRYAAACDVQVSGLALEATCAEVYSIDARTKAEAEALDASMSSEPPDVAAFYAECRALKVPGSGRQIWMFPALP